MLNIILYILIGSGIGCFVFLIYKKWSQIQKEDSPSIKFSNVIIKRALQRLIARFKQIPGKCKQLRIKNILGKIKKINFITIKEFFKREKIHRIFIFAKKLKIKAKNRISIMGNALKKTAQRVVKIIKKVKFSKASQDKPLFETKFLEKNETNLEIPHDKKGKRFFSSLVLKTKRGIKKVKIRFISEEDQKIKKQLNRTKESIINPESYLGELLKRKEEDKIVSRETDGLSSQNDVSKSSLNKPVTKKNTKIIKLIKLIKRINIIKIIKDARNRKREKTKTLKERKKEDKIFTKEEIGEKTQAAKEDKQFSDFSNIEISKEAIKKIENKLISEILEDPKNIEAYKKLGKVYYNQDKYRYAEECFKAAIKLGSGDRKIKDLLNECEKK